MLLQFGNTLLQDQVVFASGSEDLGIPVSRLVRKCWHFHFKDIVKEKWMYRNALRLFKMD